MGTTKTTAITNEQYRMILKVCDEGYTYKGRTRRPQGMLATIIKAQMNLGIRVGDILNLTLNSFIMDFGRIRLNIIEEKTKKARTFSVPKAVYNMIKNYADENNISKDEKLFNISSRSIHRNLKDITDYLGYENCSFHSFRKTYITNIYSDTKDIELCRRLLQHSDLKTTQRYICLDDDAIENAINSHINL